jgi:hypothetical protein
MGEDAAGSHDGRRAMQWDIWRLKNSSDRFPAMCGALGAQQEARHHQLHDHHGIASRAG